MLRQEHYHNFEAWLKGFKSHSISVFYSHFQIATNYFKIKRIIWVTYLQYTIAALS